MIKQTLRQHPKLQTKLKINNKIITSFNILQMSYDELIDFTKNESEKNPFIILKKKNNLKLITDNFHNKENIKEWLYQQSSTFYNNKKEKNLIEIFIENLDDNGFCRINATEASKLTNSTKIQALNILNKLKNLDPIGIFSSNIKELLHIQLIKRGIYNNYFKIILNNLNYVAEYNIIKLSELCNLPKNNIIKLIQIIKNCKPRAIDTLENKEQFSIVADILLEINNEKIKATLNKVNNYEIHLNKNYINKMKLQNNKKTNKENKNFIQDYITHAKVLKNNINRRNETILSVSKKIFNYQKSYLLKGEEEILPLTHKEVGKMINMHESTVSRAIKNKYVYFDHKTIPLNFFFSSKIKSVNNKYSSKSIKIKIEKLIHNQEIKNYDLSDQKITKILNNNGIMISRRTVTKYRESMNIPNSRIRLRKLNN